MATTLSVKVKPNARIASLEQKPDGTWIAQVKAPPVDGKANAELCELVARRFGCRKAQVSVKHGTSGRLKLVAIADG